MAKWCTQRCSNSKVSVAVSCGTATKWFYLLVFLAVISSRQNRRLDRVHKELCFYLECMRPSLLLDICNSIYRQLACLTLGFEDCSDFDSDFDSFELVLAIWKLPKLKLGGHFRSSSKRDSFNLTTDFDWQTINYILSLVTMVPK